MTDFAGGLVMGLVIGLVLRDGMLMLRSVYRRWRRRQERHGDE